MNASCLINALLLDAPMINTPCIIDALHDRAKSFNSFRFLFDYSGKFKVRILTNASLNGLDVSVDVLDGLLFIYRALINLPKAC